MRQVLSVSAYAASLLALLALCFWLTSLDFGDFRPESPAATYVLWGLSTCVVVGAIALGFLLFRNLLKLYVERRANVIGSRLKTKLVAGVLALGLAPIALHVYFSIALLNRNFDKWFSQPTVDVLRSAERLVDSTTARSARDLRNIADRLVSGEGAPAQLDDLQELLSAAGVDYVALSRTGQSGAPLEAAMGVRPSDGLRELLGDVPPMGAQGLFEGWLYAAVPLPDSGGLLAVARRLSPADLQDLAFMRARVAEWQQLEAARPIMWRTHAYILALITIFMLFFAVWLAQFASRQITRPVEALVTAAGELEGGHLDYRVQTRAMDELGALVEAFNRMGRALEAKTAELRRSNRDLEIANAELDERRRLINAILESITSAVISVDERGRIQRFNGAARSFAAPTGLRETQRITELFEGSDRAALGRMLGSARRTGVSAAEFEVERGGRRRHIGVTVSSLDSGDTQSGLVVVLEDNTDLMRAQRSEAWQEVAQRLAHEIKNPLTPIALAAGRIERLLVRLQDETELRERQELCRRLRGLTQTIEGEVRSLSTLVGSFSDVAGFPALHPADADVNAVVREAVSVFRGRLGDTRLRLALEPGVAIAKIDRDALKRAVVNLVDNAADALHGSLVREIVVSTRRNPQRGFVELAVCDSGPGISREDKARLFLPHFSTKDRGTGLGLPIVRSVVHEHQGTIRVEDNQPAGTRFVIELPSAAQPVLAGKVA